MLWDLTSAAPPKHLIEQLEQGKSEALTAYLNAMARFHSYSFGNILSIAHHRPDATHVAGIRKWNEFGRYVKKGQKGIPILAPMIGARRQRDEEPAEQSDKPAPVLIGCSGARRRMSNAEHHAGAQTGSIARCLARRDQGCSATLTFSAMIC